MKLLQHFSSSNYIVFNKIIAKSLGINSALMLAELIYEYGYYQQNNMLSKKGYFYSTVHNVEDATTLTKYQQAQCINKMINLKLIEMINQGVPCKRYFKLNIKNIEKYILKLEGEKFCVNDIEYTSEETSPTESRNLTPQIKNIDDKDIPSPPTLEDIYKYCKEKKYNIDIVKFYDYYTNDNDEWIDKQGKIITDWKKKVLVWVANEERFNSQDMQNKISKKSLTGTEHNYNTNELERVLFGDD